MKLTRFSPVPKDRTEWFLVGLGLLALAACGLTACSDSFTLATKDYAAQVARDNMEAAKQNPISAVIHGVATLVTALAGAALITKRAIKRYDDAPMGPEDAESMEKAKKMNEALKG